MSLSNDELRAAIMVLHSSTSTTTARIAAHESVMHFEHSVVAWASALHLVQSSQSFYGIYGASILATKAKRGDYVEDRHALVIAILSVLGSIPEFQRSLRCQDETMSVQAELVIAVAAIAAPAPAMLDLLDLPAFQTLKPITALAVLEHMGSADGMSVPDIHVGAVGSRCYSGPGRSTGYLSSSSVDSDERTARIRCEAHAVTLLGPALKAAVIGGVGCSGRIRKVLSSVSAFAVRQRSMVSLPAVVASAFEVVCDVASDETRDPVVRTGAVQLLRASAVNNPSIRPFGDETISILVGIVELIFDQVECDLRLTRQSFIDQTFGLALGTSAAELAAELAMAIPDCIVATGIADCMKQHAHLALLLSRLASFSRHRHLRIAEAATPTWAACFAVNSRMRPNSLTAAHARKLLESLLERVRQGLAALNMSYCSRVDTQANAQVEIFDCLSSSEECRESLEWWIDGRVSDLISVCAKKIGITYSLASAVAMLEGADTASSNAAATVCGALAKDALAVACAGDKATSIVLDHAASALQGKIVAASNPRSRRHVILAFSKFARFCALRGGHVLDVAVAVLWGAASLGCINKLAASHLRAAEAALEALCTVSKAASDVLSDLPGLEDRILAAKTIHSENFRRLQVNIDADLSRLSRSW